MPTRDARPTSYDEDRTREALRGTVRGWHVDVVDSTGSTNADLVAAAGRGAVDRSVLVALAQTAGRGRLGREWVAPPGNGLTFSVLLRPEVSPARWGWLPLLTGLAVCEAVRSAAGVGATVKWPNDVLVDGRKLAGVLAEVAGDAVVVGVGLNVALAEDELPVPTATSLLLAGSRTLDPAQVLGAVLGRLDHWVGRFARAGGDPALAGVREAYRAACSTLGSDVAVNLPGGGELRGRAADLDDDGRLVVDADGARRTVGAGDVVHVRPDVPGHRLAPKG